MTSMQSRSEIARYLLARGVDTRTLKVPPRVMQAASRVAKRVAVALPDGLTPTRDPLADGVTAADPLPAADAVVITWTAAELAGLAKVMCPGFAADRYWQDYAHNFDAFAVNIRPSAPARQAKRLGSYQLVSIGDLKVLLLKSELHLNQDRIETGPGLATLPVKDFFTQIVAETAAQHVLTVGTAGSVYEAFGLGDAVITRAAKFRLREEFANEPYNGVSYKSDWQVPLTHLAQAQSLMETFAPQLAVPAFAPPTKEFAFPGGPITAPPYVPQIRLEQGAKDMPEFHPILTTDYFEYGTTANNLDAEGAAVEMGDAALGLACSEMATPPKWLVVRNMSDPVINGDLPAKPFHLNEQTTWAVGYYTAYGEWTSATGACAVWGVLAGIATT
jgi:nucleoside phosphorylase